MSETDKSIAVAFGRTAWPHSIVKAVVVVGYFGLWLTAYDAINAFSSDPVRTIHLTSPRSVFPGIIQPWTAMIYLIGGVILSLVPFWYYRSWRGIAFVMACMTVSSLLSFAVYWTWPVSMVRPEFTGSAVGERLMLLVFSVDEPGSSFSSLHATFAVLGALLIGRAGVRPAALRFWRTFAAAVCVATVTSGQHSFIDVPGGAAVALMGFAVGYWLMPPVGPRLGQSQVDCA
jgi:membrane-associated phospholipid phosphatase